MVSENIHTDSVWRAASDPERIGRHLHRELEELLGTFKALLPVFIATVVTWTVSTDVYRYLRMFGLELTNEVAYLTAIADTTKVRQTGLGSMNQTRDTRDTFKFSSSEPYAHHMLTLDHLN